MLSLSRVHQRHRSLAGVSRIGDTPTRGGLPNRAEFQALSQFLSQEVFVPTGSFTGGY